MLALPQGSWAPDIISGLVILNSRLVGEGDVIEYGDGGDRVVGVVFRTKVFYTEVLHLVNNHRVTMQNARLRALTIHNLSRFASARGLRESISIKVSYGVEQQRINALFENVFQRAAGDSSIAVEPQYEPEIGAFAAGDYAVEWSCFYYTKDAKYLIRTRQLLLALTLETAREQGISLATPDLYRKIS